MNQREQSYFRRQLYEAAQRSGLTREVCLLVPCDELARVQAGWIRSWISRVPRGLDLRH